MTAFTITYSLRRNDSCFMSAGPVAHRIDLAAGQTHVTLARGYGR